MGKRWEDHGKSLCMGRYEGFHGKIMGLDGANRLLVIIGRFSWRFSTELWLGDCPAMFDCQREEDLNDGPILTGNSGNLLGQKPWFSVKVSVETNPLTDMENP